MAFSHIYMWERGVIHLELQCEDYKIHLGGLKQQKTHFQFKPLFKNIKGGYRTKNTSVRPLH